MTKSAHGLGRAALRLLERLDGGTAGLRANRGNAMRVLIDSGLAQQESGGGLRITAAGRAWLLRLRGAGAVPDINPFRARHADLVCRSLGADGGPVLVNEAESPLAWLARRKGRDGRALIEPHQYLAGERLRQDFTFAQMMPRTTADWESPIGGARRAPGAGLNYSESAAAARQRLRRAVEAVGPEFSGLLVDVCCFLKRLEQIEQERIWPARSAKIVLQLGLERLARHYGLTSQASGKMRAASVAWTAAESGKPAAAETT